MKWFKRRTFRKVVAETNIFDVAIGLAIAGVFINLVNSFVANLLSPPVGALIKGRRLGNLEFHFAIFPGQDPVVFRYGLFIDAFIEFCFVAFVVYWAARFVLKIKKRGIEELNNHKKKTCLHCCMLVPAKATKCPYCLENPFRSDEA